MHRLRRAHTHTVTRARVDPKPILLFIFRFHVFRHLILFYFFRTRAHRSIDGNRCSSWLLEWSRSKRIVCVCVPATVWVDGVGWMRDTDAFEYNLCHHPFWSGHSFPKKIAIRSEQFHWVTGMRMPILHSFTFAEQCVTCDTVIGFIACCYRIWGIRFSCFFSPCRFQKSI